MATCRDCICEDVCSRKNNVLCQLDTFVYEEYSNMPNVEKYCEHFKSKSDYVKRERGEWIKQGKDWHCKCSICGGESFYHLDSTPSNFCPNCGVDMRKEDNNG